LPTFIISCFLISLDFIAGSSLFAYFSYFLLYSLPTFTISYFLSSPTL